MNRELPFDSIESTHEFFGLLAKALLEAKRDVDTDIQREKGSDVSRRLKALQGSLGAAAAAGGDAGATRIIESRKAKACGITSLRQLKARNV